MSLGKSRVLSLPNVDVSPWQKKSSWCPVHFWKDFGANAKCSHSTMLSSTTNTCCRYWVSRPEVRGWHATTQIHLQDDDKDLVELKQEHPICNLLISFIRVYYFSWSGSWCCFSCLESPSPQQFGICYCDTLGSFNTDTSIPRLLGQSLDIDLHSLPLNLSPVTDGYFGSASNMHGTFNLCILSNQLVLSCCPLFLSEWII